MKMRRCNVQGHVTHRLRRTPLPLPPLLGVSLPLSQIGMTLSRQVPQSPTVVVSSLHVSYPNPLQRVSPKSIWRLVLKLMVLLAWIGCRDERRAVAVGFGHEYDLSRSEPGS